MLLGGGKVKEPPEVLWNDVVALHGQNKEFPTSHRLFFAAKESARRPSPAVRDQNIAFPNGTGTGKAIDTKSASAKDPVRF